MDISIAPDVVRGWMVLVMAEYIDREAFIAQKRELYCKDCDRRKGMKNGKYRILYDIGDVPCRACGIEDVLSDVEDFPAADVQPVVHGKWLPIIEANEYGDAYQCGTYCSECGETLQSEPNFCPNCGADMRGE